MAVVTAKANEPIESLVRRFKREVEKSGVIATARGKQRHTPPSVERKLEKNRRKRRNLRSRDENPHGRSR